MLIGEFSITWMRSMPPSLTEVLPKCDILLFVVIGSK